MDPKREFPRLLVRVTTVMRLVKTGKAIRVMTQNLGAGGLCFTIDHPLENGEPLELEICFPDTGNSGIIKAEVVWTREARERKASFDKIPTETGVKFTEISDKDKLQINQYVRMNTIPM